MLSPHRCGPKRTPLSSFSNTSKVRGADRGLALATFLILLGIFTATMVTQPDVLDGEVEFQTASALARGHTLALGGTPEGDAVREQGFNGRYGGPGREGEYFSWFGVGQAFVAVPFYGLGVVLSKLAPRIEERNARDTFMGVARSEYFPHLAVLWRNSILTAWTAALILLASRRLGASRLSSLIAGLSYGLCTFAWPQARSTLNSVQSTFFLFLAFHGILILEERVARVSRADRRTLVWIGIALGGAFLTRPLTAPVLVVLGIALVTVLERGGRLRPGHRGLLELGWCLLPALALFALFLWTNLVRFGDPFEQGYGDVVTWDGYFNYPLHLGLAGILFSPGQGLFWMAPGALLVFPFVVALVRRRRFALPLLLAGVAAAVLVPVSMTVGWHGAWGYGPRYALPLLPFLWIAVAPTLDRAQGLLAGRILAGVLLGFGAVVSLGGVLVDTTTHTDLALQAARLEWPTLPGNAATQEEERFQRIRWDLRFAAPFAHWRILRHRIATGDDAFPIDEIFFSSDRRPEVSRGEAHPVRLLRPTYERERGWRHLAWVDFHERLGGPVWPVVLFCLGLVVGGMVLVSRNLGD